jgi:hypothetical protein
MQLADKWLDYEVRAHSDSDVNVFTSYVHLTRLVLTGLPSGDVPVVLTPLTALKELGLEGSLDHSLVDVLHQAAGMSQLRSLQLEGWGGYTAEETGDMAGVEWQQCLAQCTQLTSLGLLVVEEDEAAVEHLCVVALQQLTGLRCLTVLAQLLLCEQGMWLPALTQLTCLCVELTETEAEQASARNCEEMYPATAQWLLGQVQQWPPQLQQVVFQLEHMCMMGFHSITPMRWQFGAAPGNRQITAWLEESDQSAARWARPFCPCPHLRGVWELQGPVQSRPWHLVRGPTYDMTGSEQQCGW